MFRNDFLIYQVKKLYLERNQKNTNIRLKFFANSDGGKFWKIFLKYFTTFVV